MLFAVQMLSLIMVALGGLAVVITRDPTKQAIIFSIYGLILTLCFLLLQAPDVALSELTVGSAALPLMLLVAIAKARRYER